MIARDTLAIWTVTAHPADMPECPYVARAHRIGAGGRIAVDRDFLAAETLEAIRAKLPPGLHRENPAPDDDPVIVEVWF